MVRCKDKAFNEHMMAHRFAVRLSMPPSAHHSEHYLPSDSDGAVRDGYVMPDKEVNAFITLGDHGLCREASSVRL